MVCRVGLSNIAELLEKTLYILRVSRLNRIVSRLILGLRNGIWGHLGLLVAEVIKPGNFSVSNWPSPFLLGIYAATCSPDEPM